MLNYDGVDEEARKENELGMVICKICNEVMYTLPTNRVCKIPGVCTNEACVEKSTNGKGESA